MNPEGAELRVRWLLPSLGLWAAAALLAGAAVLTRSAPLLLLAVPLLVAPVAAGASVPRGHLGGRLAWAAGGGDRSVEVRGTLELDPGLPADSVMLRFYPVEPLVGRSAPVLDVASGVIGITWSLTARQPCVVVLPIPSATWRDPLGLVERPIRIDGTALRIDRFPPEVARLRATHLRRTTVFPGEVRSAQHGPSGDFFALRPSIAGDTPRQINWKATARSGALRANEFLRERTGDLLIVLDLRPTPLGPRRDGELLSIARSAAFGIASTFLAEKARVGLATFDEYATALPLASGRRQAFRIRAALQAARVGDVAGPVERLAVSLRRYFPPGVGTLVISSLSDDEGPLLLAHLRRRGFEPFVLAPSPLPLLTPADGRPGRVDALAARLLHLARRQRLAAAWREAPVIDWEEYWSLGPLVRFLSRPPERRTGAA